MKTSFLRKKSNSPLANAKERIQFLCREVGILRQKGKCFFAGKIVDGKIHWCTSNVLQFDHINSRQFNVSYANPDCGVVICKSLHGWKHFTDRNTKAYHDAVMKYLPPARRKLVKRVEADRKSYPMGLYEWNKEILALEQMVNQLGAPQGARYVDIE